MDPNVLQRIQISHNFTESWMITQEENFNGISFYDPTHGKVILLVLDKYDDGQDYHEIINQVNDLLLSEPSEEEFTDQLERIYALTASVYRAREAVLMKLAQEVADLKLDHHEIKRSVEIISNFTNDGATRILLFLALNEPATRTDIAKHVRVTDRWLDELLNRLLDQKIIGVKKRDGTVRKEYYII